MSKRHSIRDTSELTAGMELATVTREKRSSQARWRQGRLQVCPDGLWPQELAADWKWVSWIVCHKRQQPNIPQG